MEEITDFLRELGVGDIIVSYAACCGKEQRIEIYRGKKCTITLIGKVKIEAVIPDVFADSVIQAVAEIAIPREPGDSKIITIALDEAIG